MLIGSQFKLCQINKDFTVKVNNTPLERVIKHKALGVQIDEYLNWRPHIHTISKKISAQRLTRLKMAIPLSGIAILRRASHFIPFDTRVNMYNALVMPYFNYCGAETGKKFSTKINRGFARQPCCMTRTMKILCIRIKWNKMEVTSLFKHVTD